MRQLTPNNPGQSEPLPVNGSVLTELGETAIVVEVVDDDATVLPSGTTVDVTAGCVVDGSVDVGAAVVLVVTMLPLPVVVGAIIVVEVVDDVVLEVVDDVLDVVVLDEVVVDEVVVVLGRHVVVVVHR